MKLLLALLCAVVALGLSLALLAFVLVTLAFSGESYRRGMTPVHQAANTVATLVAFIPLVLTLWASWRRFFSSKPWDDVPLGWGLPLLVCVGCTGVCLLAFFAGEWVESFKSERRRSEARATLRAEVEREATAERGAPDKSCDLVVLDPKATPEDMRRCRAHIESLPSPEARWAEFLKFLDDTSGFQTWTPKQVGLAPDWDWNRRVVVVRHDQEWFLQAFYETWFARPDAFQSEKDLERLVYCLRDTSRWDGWTHAALEVHRTRVLPEIARRVEAQHAVPRDAPVMEWLRELLPPSPTSPEERPEPPLPKLDSVPEGTIGLAQLADDGELHLWLRATPTSGAFGDVYLSYPPSDEHSGKWKRHLGSMKPGQVRPVPPLE